MKKIKALTGAMLALAMLTTCNGCALDDVETYLTDLLGGASSNGEGSCTVYYLDVGQGDSELIVTDTCAVLIDAGEIGQGQTVLADLENAGVDHLDWIIATHPHSDHIGGIPDILSYDAQYADFTVDNIMLPVLSDEMTPTTQVYERLLDGIEADGLTLTEAVEMTIDLGSATLEIIPPPSQDYTDLNDFSILAYLTSGDNVFLFTGDASKPEENDLLDAGQVRRADVLKVGHHGSRESSTEDFLAAVRPSYAVISCGANNSYGHPTDEALTRLSQWCGDSIVRTDEDGTVSITSNGSDLTVKKHLWEKS